MRHKILRTALLGLFLMSCPNSLEAKEWRGIVPLKSTRADVEKLLGKPNELGRYELQNERVHFYYAKGSANKADDCWCLAAEDTVLTITVEPEAYIKFSDLKLERRRYKKSRGGHLPTIVTYSNDDEGVIYTVDDEDDEVMEITFVPSARDCRNLVKGKRANSGRSSRLRPKQGCRGISTYNYDNNPTILHAASAEPYSDSDTMRWFDS